MWCGRVRSWRRAFAILGILGGSALGCGGADGSTAPQSAATLSVNPSQATAEVGRSSTLTAAALAANGARIPGYAVTWQQTGSQIATLVADGESATVTGLTTGTDTVTVSANGGTLRASTVVHITPPLSQVAQIRFAGRLAFVSAAQTVTLAVIAENATSQPLAGITPAYTVFPSTLGSIDSAGRFTVAAGASGRGVVLATVGSHIDTLTVIVGGSGNDLAVMLSDSVVRQGRPITVMALASPTPSLAGSSLTLGGQLAITQPTQTGGQPGSVSFIPNAALFASCQPVGSRVTGAFTVGTSSRTINLALFAPALTATLAVGQMVMLTSAMTTACPIELSQTGTYVVMPFTWDAQESDNLGYGAPAPQVTPTDVVVAGGFFAGSPSPGSVADRVRVIHSSYGTAVGADPVRSFGTHRLTPHLAIAHGDVLRVPNRAIRPPRYPINPRWQPIARRRRIPVTRSPLGVAAPAADIAPPTSGGSCPVPLTLGATVQLGTDRASDGTFLQPGAPQGSLTDPTQGDPVETWTLVGFGASVAILGDTGLVTALATTPGATNRIQKLADAYDSTIAPFIARNSVGVPDHDGNHRVVVLLAKHGRNGYAFLEGYGRADCTDVSTNLYGEAVQPTYTEFWQSDAQFNRDFAGTLSVLAHETAHLADEQNYYFNPTGTPREETWWSSEGQAVLMQYLWAYGDTVTAARAFGSHTASPPSRTVEGSSTFMLCQQSSHSALTTWYDLGSYQQACQYVRYVFAQAYRQNPSLTIRALFTQWADISSRISTGRVLTAMLGTTISDHDAMRDWLVSWYATGYVPGVDPTLTDPSVLLRQWWSAAYPLPDAIMAIGVPQSAQLSAPDVRYYEAAFTTPGWIAVVGPGNASLPTNRVDGILLRSQ